MNLYKSTGGVGPPSSVTFESHQVRKQFFDYSPLKVPLSTTANYANSMPNIPPLPHDVRLRRPQPQGGSAESPQLKGKLGIPKTNGHSRHSSSSSMSPASSSSSFCDDLKSQGGYRQSGQQHFMHDLEHDIVENWLEVEFQRQFKRLNTLIRKTSNSGIAANEFDTSSDNEILFLKQKSNAWNDYESSLQSDQRKVIQSSVYSSDFVPSTQNGSRKDPNLTNPDMCQSNAIQLTNWLMARRTGGAVSVQEQQSKCIKSQIIHEEQDFEPVILRPKNTNSPKPASYLSQNSDWLGKRLAQLEDLIMSPEPQPTSIPTPSENLIFLALTEPNDKANRDTLLYAYPDMQHASGTSNSQNFEYTYPLIKLGGMFITLSEIVDILQPINVNNCDKDFQKYRLQVIPQSNSNTKESPAKEQTTDKSRTYLFTLVRKQFSTESLTSMDPRFSKSKHPPTILLLVGLPEDGGFTETDSKCVAALIQTSIEHRFGSIQVAFESYFRTSMESLQTTTSNFLSNKLALFETLFAPPNESTSSLEAMLALSNTFFCSGPSNRTSLPLRHLPSDDSVITQVCKLLNYYDSLDWIDEAIARFYRKDRMDLEHALSEHFARCLQWCPESIAPQIKSNHDNEMSTSFMSHDHHEDTNNNGSPHLFDLLELELSSFVVVGSALFYRGFLVQSNLAHHMLNPVYRQLFSKGLLALTKHLSYDLVYFTNCPELDSTDTASQLNQNHFILILGYGHMLHCCLLQVHCFDRASQTTNDSLMGSIGPNGTLAKQSTTAAASLPSSFAFYVFIKESFRFLCYNLNLMISVAQSPVDSHLEQLLENVYRLGKQISAENFSLVSMDDKKTKKLKDKLINKDKKFSFSKKKDKNDANSKDKLMDRQSLIVDTNRASSINVKSQNLTNSPVSLQSRNMRPHPHSDPSTPVKSSRPRSLYSNWSYSSIITGNSISSNSSVTSLGETSDCQCSEPRDTPHRGSFDLRSLQSTITSKSITSTDCSELRYGSIYRFSHRYLPESLIVYLNVEPARQLESFYSPLTDGEPMMELFNHDEYPNQSGIISSVTAKLIHEILELRNTVRKLAELQLKQRRAKHRPSSDVESTSSGRIFTLYYDLITCKPVQAQDLTNHSLIVSFQFYLLGQCLIDTAIGDEFYACFKLNNQNGNNAIAGNLLESKSNRSSKWSIGRFSLRLENSPDSAASKSKKRHSSFLNGSADRSNQYELNRLDYLRGDFDELIQTVRLGGPSWH